MKDFKKYYIIPEEPEIVYQALTNAHTIRLWTGSPAVMNTEPGSEFSLWDGNITGKNLEFIENKKIVQKWDFDGQEEDSIVSITLHPHKQGTSVELRHSNIPDNAYDDISEGWTGSYFGSWGCFMNSNADLTDLINKSARIRLIRKIRVAIKNQIL